MPAIRESFTFVPGSGTVARYLVDYVDGGGRREATFDRRSEAEAFAAKLAAPRRAVASLGAVQRANRALLDRIANDTPPRPATLGGALRQIADRPQTRLGRVR